MFTNFYECKITTSRTLVVADYQLYYKDCLYFE